MKQVASGRDNSLHSAPTSATIHLIHQLNLLQVSLINLGSRFLGFLGTLIGSTAYLFHFSVSKLGQLGPTKRACIRIFVLIAPIPRIVGALQLRQSVPVSIATWTYLTPQSTFLLSNLTRRARMRSAFVLPNWNFFFTGQW